MEDYQEEAEQDETTTASKRKPSKTKAKAKAKADKKSAKAGKKAASNGDGGRKRRDPAVLAQIKAMVKEGKKQNAIAAELGISRGAVWSALHPDYVAPKHDK